MSHNKALDGLSREQLIELLEIYSKNWLAADGIWFQSVERRLGMDEAMYHDVEIWKKFTVVEALKLKKFLGLPEQAGNYKLLPDYCDHQIIGGVNYRPMRWLYVQAHYGYKMECNRHKIAATSHYFQLTACLIY